MKFCPECGSKLVSQKYCVQCGTNLSRFFKHLEEKTEKEPKVTQESESRRDGIGFLDFSSLENEAKKQLEERQRLDKINAEFEIENGVLKKYRGNDTAVTIPAWVTSIDSGAFADSPNIESVIFEDNSNFSAVRREAFAKAPKNIHITDLGAWCKVNAIYLTGCTGEANLYVGNELVTHLDIPYGVETIGFDSFCGFGSIRSVTLPSTVRMIDAGAFMSCRNLTSISIPSSVGVIESSAFYSCSSLSSITIPSSVYKIGNEAFGFCSSLREITLPTSITSVGDFAFKCCSGLVSVTLPPYLTSISGWMFDGCDSLASITIPDSVTSIGEAAFRSCIRLRELTIPRSVSSIKSSAFDYCNNLTSVTVEGPTRLSHSELHYALSKCGNLKTVRMPEGLASDFASSRWHRSYSYEIITN